MSPTVVDQSQRLCRTSLSLRPPLSTKQVAVARRREQGDPKGSEQASVTEAEVSGWEPSRLRPFSAGSSVRCRSPRPSLHCSSNPTTGSAREASTQSSAVCLGKALQLHPSRIFLVSIVVSSTWSFYSLRKKLRTFYGTGKYLGPKKPACVGSFLWAVL